MATTLVLVTEDMQADLVATTDLGMVDMVVMADTEDMLEDIKGQAVTQDHMDAHHSMRHFIIH